VDEAVELTEPVIEAIPMPAQVKPANGYRQNVVFRREKGRQMSLY
jgi:hypothetical protein